MFCLWACLRHAGGNPEEFQPPNMSHEGSCVSVPSSVLLRSGNLDEVGFGGRMVGYGGGTSGIVLGT